mmetsp:Transcript_48917/g.116284  ORF Transcript_48917/g.116284 Transcript_48917/m.116284 type:complete len:911 (-) Transcript_48917:34-2766(-)
MLAEKYMDQHLQDVRARLVDGFAKLLDEHLELKSLKADIHTLHDMVRASTPPQESAAGAHVHSAAVAGSNGSRQYLSKSNSTMSKEVTFDNFNEAAVVDLDDLTPAANSNGVQVQAVDSTATNATARSNLASGEKRRSPTVGGSSGARTRFEEVTWNPHAHTASGQLTGTQSGERSTGTMQLDLEAGGTGATSANLSETGTVQSHEMAGSHNNSIFGSGSPYNQGPVGRGMVILEEEELPVEAAMAGVLSAKSTQSMLSQMSILEQWERVGEDRRDSRAEGSTGRHRASTVNSLVTNVVQQSNPSSRVGSMSSMSRMKSNGEFSQGCVLGPNSKPACLWALWTAVIVVYDMIVVPLVVFDVAKSVEVPILTWMEWASLLTWAIDMVLTFFTGYPNERKGSVEMRHGVIAANYLKTWFLLDFFLVMVDVVLLTSAKSVALAMLTSIRGIRVLRVVKVIRAIKMSMKWGRVSEVLSWFFVGSDRTAALLNISHNLLVMMVLSHFVACGWYAVGYSGNGDGWVDFDEGCEDTWYCYLTAYHWAVTQFTPAAMRTDGHNTPERAFCIFAVFAGLLVFSAFVGRMTQAMTHLHALSANARQQRMLAHRYLHENTITMDVATRILSFLHNVRHRTSRLTMNDISSFENLPRSLKHRLTEEVFTPLLQLHPLFDWLSEADAPTFKTMCHNALQERTFTPAEEAFSNEMPAEWMLFIIGGKLFYVSDINPEAREVLEKGQRLCEIALWCNWTHRGNLTSSMKPSDAIQLNCASFCTSFSKSIPRKQLFQYARLFITRACRTSGGSRFVLDTWGADKDIMPICKMIVPNAFLTATSAIPLLAFATQGTAALMASVMVAWREVAVQMIQDRKRGFLQRMVWQLHGLLFRSVWAPRLKRKRSLPPRDLPAASNERRYSIDM